MKKQLTYQQLQKFDNLATSYLIRNGYFIPSDGRIPGKFTDEKPTKLVLNMKNVIKQAGKHFETYKELANDIRLDNCLVDEKTKAVLYEADGVNFKFSKDGLREVTKAIKDLSQTEVEIHIRITEGDLALTDEEKEAFNGIIISEFKPEE